MLGHGATRAAAPRWSAILFTTALAMVLISTGDLSDLADTTVLLLLVVFIAVNVCVLVLRRDRVDHRHFRAPTVFPIIGDRVCVALMYREVGRDLRRAPGSCSPLGVVFWAISRCAD